MLKGLAPMRIFVVRHGQTDFNLLKQPQKGKDPSLNSTGISESHKCSEYLTQLLNGNQVDAVFYSPLKRTTETMEILIAGRPAPRLIEPAEGLKQGSHTYDVKNFLAYATEKISIMGLQNVLFVSHGPIIKYMFQWLSETDKLIGHRHFHTPRNSSVAEIVSDETNDAFILRSYDSLP